VAVTNEQKIDFLLKKIGFTKTKTGSVVGTGAISGTPKQPFAEAIPSPLIIANGALWNESGSIPTTPPGSDTTQVKVYLAASSGLRMTADATSSNQRAYIAYSTYGNASSTRLTNWIDTQFGSAYLIKVYKGDPNSGGVALSAAGSGANDGWFFDYSAGVLNFNDTSVPSGVTDTNIYIVGYRYIGSTGAPTPSGGGNFTYNDLVVSRNFQVAGLSTFNGLVDINAGGQANTFKVEDLTDNRIVIAGTGGELEDSANLTFDGSTLAVTGDATFSGNVAIGGTLTYEDVKNIDAVGLITARSGIRVTGGVIEAQAGENKIPSLYAAMGNLPAAGSYHGMFAHVHATARGYFAHAGNWLELVNREINGVVGTGTETYNIGNLVSTSSTATSFNVTGVTTTVTLDVNGDIDVDGHTNLDNVSVAGVTTHNEDVWFKGATSGRDAYWDKSADTLKFADNARLTFGDHTNGDAQISHDGTKTFINAPTAPFVLYTPDLEVRNSATNALNFKVDTDGAVGLYHGTPTSKKLETSPNGINITGGLTVSGVSTFTGAIDANGDLDVDGHTNLDNVSIAGVTSVASLTSGRVVTVGTAGKLQDSNNLTFDGSNLFVSGINITGGGATSILGADIVTRNLKATGISTFNGAVQFDSTIKAGGSNGTNGQYLKTTATGVEWASFPTMRTSQTFTASSGQTTFSFSYTVGFLDVFVNGVKLASSEFTATNGSTVVLAVGSFVGDIVELISYYTVSGGGGGGGGGISNVVEDTTPQLGGNLDLFNKSITGTGNINITGVATATKFVGDGSGLTGVTGSGSGVAIRNSGSIVGTAGTIDFGDNLSVSPVSAGIVTITGSAGVTTSQFDVNKLDVSGISTFTGLLNANGNITISNSAPQLNFVDANHNPDYSIKNFNGKFEIKDESNGSIKFAVNSDGHIDITANTDFLDGIDVTGNATVSGDLDVDGHTNLDNVSIAGVTTFTGSISSSDIRSNALNLKNAAGSATYATFSNGGAAVLKWNNTDRLATSNAGITVTGTVAATSYTGDGSQLTGIGAGSTANIITNNLQVLGISTFIGIATFAGEVQTGTGSTVGIGSTAYVHKIAFKEAGSNNSTDTAAIGNQGSSLKFIGGSVQNGVWGNSGLKIAGNGASTLTGPESNCTLEVVSSENTRVLFKGSANTGLDFDSSSPNNGVANYIRSDKDIIFYTGYGSAAGVSTNFKIGQKEGSTFYSSVGIRTNYYPLGAVSISMDAISGIVTATKFVGDGSSLTGVGGAQQVFKTIAVAGQSDVVADTTTDTLTLVAGSNMTITTNAGSDTITFASSGGGGGGGTDVGITTSLTGTFTASAGSPSTINTFAYHDNDMQTY